MTANDDENKIYAVTSSGQLIMAPIVLESNGIGRTDQIKFDYVIGTFHKTEITGLDVNIRKELIVTCSRDKSVNIWNYTTKKHEIT